MSDAETGAGPAADREPWIRNLRRVNEQQEDALAPDFDALYRRSSPPARRSWNGFCSCSRPPAGCWTRPAAPASTSRWCWPAPLAARGGSRRRPPGHRHYQVPAGPQRQARPPGPPLPPRVRRRAVRGRHGVRPTRGLAAGAGALRPGPAPGGLGVPDGRACPGDRLRTGNQAARRAGLPVVDGEVLWEEADGYYYHHYPTMTQVRAWLAEAGFAIQEEAEGPLAPGGVRLSSRAGPPGGPSTLRSSAVTEDNLALDVRGSPGKTAVRMALT
jgi:hypothetical protein